MEYVSFPLSSKDRLSQAVLLTLMTSLGVQLKSINLTTSLQVTFILSSLMTTWQQNNQIVGAQEWGYCNSDCPDDQGYPASGAGKL